MQAEPSWESSGLDLFKLLATTVLVCKEKTVCCRLLCTCAKGWSTEMQIWPWDTSSLESTWSCLTPWHHPGRMDKLMDSFPSPQAQQTTTTSSLQQLSVLSVPHLCRRIWHPKCWGFWGKHGENHLQPGRKTRAGISCHLQSQKSETISWPICCPLPAKIETFCSEDTGNRFKEKGNPITCKPLQNH